jgi:competence protein ComEC
MSLWTGGIGGSGPHGSSGRDIPDGHRSGPAPLLGWQLLLGGYLLGVLAMQYRAAAATALCLLLLSMLLIRRERPHIGAILLAFFLGLGWAHVRMPEAPAGVPEWMQQREYVLVRAQVDKVRSKPGDRLQVFLSEVRCTPEGGRGGAAGRDGSCGLGRSPTLWPDPGQTVEGVFRIRPVREFRNPGGWESEFHWQREGVFYRTFTFRDKAEITFSPARGGIRTTLRERLASAAPCQGGAILAAVLLGERYFLDQTTVELMQKSSLSHSLAQSGLHLGLVVSMGLLLAWLAGILWPSLLLVLPRSRLAVLLALPPALFYVWLGQGSPSLLRAGLMFLFWGAAAVSRKGTGSHRRSVHGPGRHPAVSPLSAFDLSLQLSAGAVAGITLFWPVFNGWISPDESHQGGPVLFYPLRCCL